MTCKLIAILGPTASGKSAVAMAVARRRHGEIVSCDSMQLYRGLDIGTAKPTPAERQEIPHHLIDCLELHEPYSANRFCADAEAAIADIFARGRQPVLCGGTGLYARALLYGFELWPGDPGLAADIRREYAAGNGKDLFAELRAAAPDLAAQLQPNPRRWLRALEVLRLTGAPPSAQEEHTKPVYATPEFVLMPAPACTRELIRRRTVEMLAHGWLDEAASARDAGLLNSPTAAQALGYAEIIRFLDGDIPSLAELTERLVILTARYAKRQRTWFRRQHPDAVTIPVAPGDPAEAIAEDLLNRYDEGLSTPAKKSG